MVKTIQNTAQGLFIALYGGSFDPLHYAHLEIIHILCENPMYKQIILMPNYRNPLKNHSFFEPFERLEMCRILANEINDTIENKKYASVIVSDYEVCQKKSVFSVQSVAFIKEQMAHKYPNIPLVFVLGEDSFRNLGQWKDVEKLCEMVDFVLIEREISQEDSQKLSYIVPYARVIERLNLPSHIAYYSSSYVRSLLQSNHIDEALEFIPQCLHTFIKTHIKL